MKLIHWVTHIRLLSRELSWTIFLLESSSTEPLTSFLRASIFLKSSSMSTLGRKTGCFGTRTRAEMSLVFSVEMMLSFLISTWDSLSLFLLQLPVGFWILHLPRYLFRHVSILSLSWLQAPHVHFFLDGHFGIGTVRGRGPRLTGILLNCLLQLLAKNHVPS